tara:strand:+ start:309 stop:572 length:264 start_codon:yes stop_codon:yes gene_type:complete
MEKVVKEVLSEAADALFKILERDRSGTHPAWITLSKVDYLLSRKNERKEGTSKLIEAVLPRYPRFTGGRVRRRNPKVQDYAKSVGSL